jgi:matrixin
MKLLFVVTISLTAAACSRSGSSPTAPDAVRAFEGQTVSAIDGAATGVVSIRIGNGSAVQTDANGNFHVDVGDPGTYVAVVSGRPVVERRTSVTGPTSERTKISLIPAGFDLDAFDEMFRGANSRLQRWMERPSLVVLGSVMKYASGDRDEYEATAEQLNDAETAALVAHLNEGLALLTGGTYTSFASVVVERPQAGQPVNVHRGRTIVVGRYVGIQTLRNTIGYGAWADQPDGTVVGGAMWLDRDFDRDNMQRRLLRIHELGHALGYNHVTARASVMNPVLGPEPTDFDRDGALIAFQRPVGNTSPDTDPGGKTRALGSPDGPARWSAPIP